ncbi:hypothetical protein, partial [Staphylococcus aureus]|uniref:hypothetical protein n=1 Tax=Staphylococcus aureus TaxID=1280 RepID=UPI0038B40C3B
LTHVLSVWEVNEDDSSAEAGEYCLQKRRRVHELDGGMVDEYANYWIYLLVFDPNNDGTLYMHIGPDTTVEREIKMYNIVTREWSKIVKD